eukprot:PLAT10699.1.p1 GENE.PLAT10699.1~~PLAT10699.1.p1  ORF type:complete len:440 (+),score=108.93 PLAT10699.1:53-1372(+)
MSGSPTKLGDSSDLGSLLTSTSLLPDRKDLEDPARATPGRARDYAEEATVEDRRQKVVKELERITSTVRTYPMRIVPIDGGQSWAHTVDPKQTAMYYLLEAGAFNNRTEMILVRSILAIIMLSVVMVVLETLQDKPAWAESALFIFELVTTIIFTIEIAARLALCHVDPTLETHSEFKQRHAMSKLQWHLRKRLRYLVRPMTLLDIAAIFPFYAMLVAPESNANVLRVLRLFRLLRMFKFSRYTQSIGILVKAYEKKKEQLFTTLVLNIMLLVTSASLVYFFESKAQPDVFTSIPVAMWWGVAALTTVGYGDIYPITFWGRIVGSAAAFLGIGLFALPAGILSNGFIDLTQEVKEERARAVNAMSRIVARMTARRTAYAFSRWSELTAISDSAKIRHSMEATVGRLGTTVEGMEARLDAIESKQDEMMRLLQQLVHARS